MCAFMWDMFLRHSVEKCVAKVRAGLIKTQMDFKKKKEKQFYSCTCMQLSWKLMLNFWQFFYVTFQLNLSCRYDSSKCHMIFFLLYIAIFYLTFLNSRGRFSERLVVSDSSFWINLCCTEKVHMEFWFYQIFILQFSLLDFIYHLH